MGFLKFLLGVVLIIGSLIFGAAIIFASPFVGSSGPLAFWAIVTFVALVGGIYLVRHH